MALVLPEDSNGDMPELALPPDVDEADNLFEPQAQPKKRGRPRGSGGNRASKKPAASPKAAGKAKAKARAQSSEKKKELTPDSQDLRKAQLEDPGMPLVIGPEIPWRDVINMIETIVEKPNESLRDHYWEVFCPQRVGPLIRERGYRSSRSIDLKTGWDLDDETVQHQVFIDLVRERPYFVLLSPPCTYFSNLMVTNWGRMGAQKYGNMHFAVRQLDFCMLIADFQAKSGGYYVFEHPATAQSWKRATVAKLQGFQVKFDQCRFGLKCANGKLIKKSTVLMYQMILEPGPERAEINRFQLKAGVLDASHGIILPIPTLP
ncbi:hypothetical protein AK812_SmicGene39524 [Symbiodinium microadriaticum]|uniref:Uncharacterized protein n=1 Tax=Symbiodinium microadriaticum TaxID=2951 RepID=A0A1Q9CB05_SYMMI|nr:hypothetical protein AK812_SmicGene39524 [Symbiodinium microadriaticum]